MQLSAFNTRVTTHMAPDFFATVRVHTCAQTTVWRVRAIAVAWPPCMRLEQCRLTNCTPIRTHGGRILVRTAQRRIKASLCVQVKKPGEGGGGDARAYRAGHAHVALSSDEGPGGRNGEVEGVGVARVLREAGLGVDAVCEVEGGVDRHMERRVGRRRRELAAAAVHAHPLPAAEVRLLREGHRPARTEAGLDSRDDNCNRVGQCMAEDQTIQQRTGTRRMDAEIHRARAGQWGRGGGMVHRNCGARARAPVNVGDWSVRALSVRALCA